MPDNLIYLSDIAPPTLRPKGKAGIDQDTVDALACSSCGGRHHFITVPEESPPTMHCS